MKTDNTGKHACLSCGNDLAMPEDTVPGTIEDCKSFSKDGRFGEAIRVLNGMSESTPEILLLKLLCCYQAKSSGELLKKISSSADVKTFANRDDVAQLAKDLLPLKNKLLIHMLEYCILELRLTGVDMGTFRHKIKAPVVPQNKPQSAFAKMDAEEEHNEERAKKIKEAAQPKERYPVDIWKDYINTPPEHVFDNEWSKPVESLAGNIVLDILDFLAYDPNWYDPEAFSHTRQYKAQLREQEKYQNQPNEAPDEETTPMTDDEMKSRQGELLKLIEEEEAKVLRS
jgi:hypothetical protein